MSSPFRNNEIKRELEIGLAALAAVQQTQTPWNKTIFGVESGRASGKTSALLEFVASRMLLASRDEQIGIIIETESYKRKLKDAWSNLFPNIEIPKFFTFDCINDSSRAFESMVGNAFREIYIDEIFKLDQQDLRKLKVVSRAQVIAGVGTHSKTSIVWLG